MNDEEFSDWQSRPKLIYQSINGRAYSLPDELDVVSDLVLGDVLALVDENAQHYQVAYPDGRSGFVKKTESALLGSWISTNNNVATSLINHAQSLKGSPYLWGGTSTKGHIGAQSRSGYMFRPWFEGGQMPLQRRIPKFGFKNPNRVEYKAVNI